MMNKGAAMKAVFLDRDGTVIIEKDYLYQPEDIEIEARVIPALQLLQRSGYELFIVTNQSGIGRGKFSEDQYRESETKLHAILESHRVTIAKTYYCPIDPEADDAAELPEIENRKPNPGMLNQAIQEFGVDPSESFMIGDKVSDVQAGQRAHVKSVLVRTGYGQKQIEAGLEDVSPDYIAEDVYDAVVNYILD